MASFNNTDIPTTPLTWVSALFQVLSPSHAPLREAVFTPENTAALKGVAQNDSPSDQGSPTTTIPSPADWPQWPSSAAITAFMKSHASADPIEELTRAPTPRTNATGSGARSRRILPPARLAGSKIPVDFGSHLRMPFPLLPTPAIDETEELEIRPSKKQRGEGGHSRVTQVRRNPLRKVRQEKKALRGEVKSGEDTRSASMQKQPRTKTKPQPAAKKNKAESTKRDARPEALPRTRKGPNAKSPPHVIPSLPPQAEDNGPESEDEE